MLIELKNVDVNFDGQSVLHGINLTLQPGQITQIQGNSGSGLSVLLKTIAGLIYPSNGQVLYDGVDVSTLNDQQTRQLQIRTGFMFQDAALWANMTLASNLDLPLQAKFPDLEDSSRKQIIAEALKQLDFSVDLTKRPVDLSQGQQKFLSFLRAIIPGPEALVLDEPLTGMDQHWIQVVIEKLAELRAKGATLVFGCHNSENSSGLADQLVTLQQGQLSAGDKEVFTQ